MVTTFQQIFTAIGNRNFNPTQKHLPMLNTISSSVQGFIYKVNQINRKKALMNWMKTIPELNAFIMKLARDITSKYHFEPVNKTESGRNKVLRSNKFAMQVALRDIMYSQAVDMLCTGDGYGWIGKLTESKVKNLIKKAYDRMLPVNTRTELKSVEDLYLKKLYDDLVKAENKALEDIGEISGVDEMLLTPRKYRYVPSTTVENIHDQYDYTGYKHMVGGNQVIFNPKEMIHFTLMQIDGKPNGYTCVDAIIVQLELLRFMWQNMLSIQKNGGMPDKVIIAKDLQANSPSFKRLEEALHKYKLVENKHGNMLFTGDIDIKDMQSIEDMQFKELGLYITGLIAMQWGISKEAIPFIVGGTNTKVEGGGAAEDAYFEVIEWMQESFAQDMNTQLWIPYFGTKIVFDSNNLQRDIRLETANMNKYNNIITMDSILQKSGKQLSDMKRLSMLNLDETDIQEWKPDPMMEYNQQKQEKMSAAKGFGTQDQPKQNTPSKENQAMRDKKKKEQSRQEERQGKPNSGTGTKSEVEVKELDSKSEIYYKQLIGMDSMPVDFDMFVQLYNEDKARDMGDMIRVFMRKNEMYTTLMYKSSDFVYKTVVNNEDLEEGKISFMNFSGRIYKL